MNAPRFHGYPAGWNTPVRFLADENLDNRIIRALRLRCPDVNIERVQDTDVAGASDEAVLEWAAEHGRVVLTHDVATMIACARTRIRAHEAMPGLIAIPLSSSIGSVTADLALIAGAANMADFDGAIVFVPMH